MLNDNDAIKTNLVVYLRKAAQTWRKLGANLARGLGRQSSSHQTSKEALTMTNASSLEGFITLVLIFISSCALIRRVRSVRNILNWQNFGPLSIFHKAAIIGIRLKYQISLICCVLAFYILIR